MSFDTIEFTRCTNMAFPLNYVVFYFFIYFFITVDQVFCTSGTDIKICFHKQLKLFRLKNDQRNMLEKLDELNKTIEALSQNGTACQSSVSSMYLGCYVDKHQRLLEGAYISTTNMTTKMCHEFCIAEGMRFFLTENFYQCFCGQALKNYEKRPDSECNQACAGNKNEMCGGYWRGSVYTITETIADQPAISYDYLGCYMDQGVRLLEGAYISTTNMTTKMCLEFCINKRMRFFMTENFYQCFCGQALKNYEKRPESECNQACAGNKNEMCGGYWRGSVYTITETIAIVNLASYKYLGCYVDQGVRLLEGEKIFRTDMTTKMCHEICTNRGTQYFLTENYYHCFCGNILKNYEKRPESECNQACSGDQKEMCGGYWRASLYERTP